MMRVHGNICKNVCNILDEVDDVLLILDELLEFRADKLEICVRIMTGDEREYQNTLSKLSTA
jgi:hypothetical protein